MLKFLFSETGSSDFLARFANGSETHNVLQCPSASADRACYILDYYGIILVANKGNG
jgi:hypothetical protein